MLVAVLCLITFQSYFVFPPSVKKKKRKKCVCITAAAEPFLFFSPTPKFLSGWIKTQRKEKSDEAQKQHFGNYAKTSSFLFFKLLADNNDDNDCFLFFLFSPSELFNHTTDTQGSAPFLPFYVLLLINNNNMIPIVINQLLWAAATMFPLISNYASP